MNMHFDKSCQLPARPDGECERHAIAVPLYQVTEKKMEDDEQGSREEEPEKRGLIK
jgi:hypothetical protein